MSASSVIQAYRFVFAALIIAASLAAMEDREPHVMALASVEIAGALLFAWRRSQVAGAALLLATFAVAQAFAAGNGQWPTHLLQYAATTVFIVLLDRRLVASG